MQSACGKKQRLIEKIEKVLSECDDVIFAYLYGSFLTSESHRDIDIALYVSDDIRSSSLAVDVQIALGKETGLPPDVFDIRIVNRIPQTGDLFALLYLKRIFEENRLLVDKDFGARGDFFEKYGLKYRECEGLIYEVLQ